MGILTNLRQGLKVDNPSGKPDYHDERITRYDLYVTYYKNEDTDANTKYEKPLRVNYVRKICEIHNSFLWGQWQGCIVNWRAVPFTKNDEGARQQAERIEDFIYAVWENNGQNKLLFGAGLDGSLLGDSVFKVFYDSVENEVRLSAVDPFSFWPTWHPDDSRKFLGVTIAYKISRDDAQLLYGTRGNPPLFGDDGQALFREIWTDQTWKIFIDDVTVKNDPNPYGFIPFVHVPNLPVPHEPWGVSDIADIIKLQDELNMRLADNADDINYHAHPILLAKNLPSKTKVDELPVGPDEIWDLGKEGDVEALVWDGPGNGTMEHLRTVREIMEDTSGVTPTAFGRHTGTQRSGIALQVEMLPISQRSTWKRLIWDEALRDINRKIVRIAAQYKLLDSEALIPNQVKVVPVWSPILPRDRSALVNENVALVKSFLRSRIKALNELGEEDAEEELEKIISEAEEMMAKGIGDVRGNTQAADKQEQVTGEGLKYVQEAT